MTRRDDTDGHRTQPAGRARQVKTNPVNRWHVLMAAIGLVGVVAIATTLLSI